MTNRMRWLKRGAWTAAVLFAVLIAGPPMARAQSVQQRIEMLEKQLDALKKELATQKEKVEKQEKATAPLADIKKTIETLQKIDINGNFVGIVQQTEGLDETTGGDEAFSVGAVDLQVTYKAAPNVKGVALMRATGGNGPDSRASITTFSVLNGWAGSTTDDVQMLEAYIEVTLFNDRLTLTGGKIDLTNYVDTNAYANNKKADFLSGSFINTHTLSVPGNNPGLRARYVVIPNLVYVEAGVVNGDRDANGVQTDKFFEDVYAVAEVGVTPKIFGRQGNYRVWGFADGAGRETVDASGASRRYTAMGAGISFDQEIADWLGAFVRLGYRDSGNTNYATQAAWTAGVQFMKFLPSRPNDAIGIGYGEIRPATRTVSPQKDESRIEAYYRWHFLDNFHLSPFVQFVDNRSGTQTDSDFWVFGARLNLSF